MARYADVLFRHWVRFAILFLVLPMAIAVGSIFLIRTYQASASMWIEDPSTFGISTAAAGWNQYLTPAENQRDSLQQLLKTQSFLGKLGDKLVASGAISGPEERNQVLTSIPTRLTVTPSGSHLLTITFTCDREAICVPLIAGAIDLYRQWLGELVQGQAQLAGTFFSGQLADAQAQVKKSQDALQQYLADHPGTTLADAPAVPQLDALVRALDRDRASADTLQQRVDQLTITGAEATQLVNAVSNVVDEPALAGGRLIGIRASLKRVMLPIAASLAVAVAYLIVLTGLDQTAREPGELERRLKVPVLATIPHFSQMGKA